MRNVYITKAEYEFNMIKYNFVAVIICVSIAIVAWFSMYNYIVYSYIGAAVYMVNILILISNIIAMISHILNSMKYMIQKSVYLMENLMSVILLKGKNSTKTKANTVF